MMELYESRLSDFLLRVVRRAGANEITVYDHKLVVGEWRSYWPETPQELRHYAAAASNPHMVASFRGSSRQYALRFVVLLVDELLSEDRPCERKRN